MTFRSAFAAGLVLAAGFSGPASAEWRFESGVGVEGEASVVNRYGVKLAVECSGDGSPSVTVTPDPRPADGPRAGVEQASFLVLFDDEDQIELAARCYGADGRSACVAEPGLWTSWELVDALRGRSRIRIAHEGGAQTWTLVGSNRAISRLRGCLLP